MNRYTVKDASGEFHIIDADALGAESGLLNFSKKGSPGYIAQFKDWASYRVEVIVEPVQAPVAVEPEAERTKRQYNRKM